MNRAATQTSAPAWTPAALAPAGVLQRACACSVAAGPSGKCGDCASQELLGAAGVQAKLSIGAPNDPFEREADAMADRVMTMTRLPRVAADQLGAGVAPTPAAPIRRLAIPSAPAVTDGALTDLGNSAGSPLAPETLSYFEPRFGRPLDHVRVHNDGSANRMARDIGAHAFTHGNHVYFANGQYRPESAPGRHLIAHELAHTFQQASTPGLIQRKGGTLGGFLGNIGRAFQDAFTGSESAYDAATLTTYLDGIEKSGSVEGDYDSDNKARQVVARKLHVPKSDDVKLLLVEEMLEGFTGNDDERAILQVLAELSPAGHERAGRADMLERLYDNFHGAELDLLYPMFPALDSLHPRRGEAEYHELNFQDYINRWATENGVVMSSPEKQTLARGCIGITALEIGTLGMPDLSNCYNSFLEVRQAQEKMNAFLKLYRPDRKAIIFSKRFYMAQKPPTDKAGKVDMSGYDYSPRPGDDMTNYDYGLYDEKTGNWWHANHCDSGTLAEPRCGGKMIVYESSLAHYSRDLGDFNRQIFCVGVAVKR